MFAEIKNGIKIFSMCHGIAYVIILYKNIILGMHLNYYNYQYN